MEDVSWLVPINFLEKEPWISMKRISHIQVEFDADHLAD